MEHAAYHGTTGPISIASPSLPGRLTRFETGQEHNIPARLPTSLEGVDVTVIAFRQALAALA